MQEVLLYSDGQYNRQRERGGWAACLKTKEGYAKAWEGVIEHGSTAPRLKMIAIAEGLERLKAPCRVKVFTNLSFLKIVHDGMVKGEKSLEQQKNSDLWRRIIEAGHVLDFVLYIGHGDTPEQKEMYGAANFNAFCSNKAGTKDAGYTKPM